MLFYISWCIIHGCHATTTPVNSTTQLQSRLQWGSMQTIYIFLTWMSTCRNRMLTSFWGAPETNINVYMPVLNSSVSHHESHNVSDTLLYLVFAGVSCFIIQVNTKLHTLDGPTSLYYGFVTSRNPFTTNMIARDKVRFSRICPTWNNNAWSRRIMALFNDEIQILYCQGLMHWFHWGRNKQQLIYKYVFENVYVSNVADFWGISSLCTVLQILVMLQMIFTDSQSCSVLSAFARQIQCPPVTWLVMLWKYVPLRPRWCLLECGCVSFIDFTNAIHHSTAIRAVHSTATLCRRWLIDFPSMSGHARSQEKPSWR